MTVAGPIFVRLDQVYRRVMVALELADPITGLLVSKGLRVTAEGVGLPVRTPSGRFVWRDLDPPAKRTLVVKVEAIQGVFQPLDLKIETREYRPNIPASDLVQRFVLQPTGLYDPPSGLLAVAGMLIDAKDTRNPMPDVEARVQLRAADTSIVSSTYAAVVDARGGYVAVFPDLGTGEPLSTPPPAPEGGIVGWVKFNDPTGAVRHSGLLPVRKGRLIRIAEPFEWAALGKAPPP
jgi:hypothetical protein